MYSPIKIRNKKRNISHDTTEQNINADHKRLDTKDESSHDTSAITLDSGIVYNIKQIISLKIHVSFHLQYYNTVCML